MVITFTSPQRRVKLFAGSDVVASTGTLRAFDANGDPVGQVDGPKSVAANVFTTVFEVAIGPARISRVELFYENAAFEAIDDLEFDGEPPAPPPPTPPVVQITTPLNGAELDVTRIDIAGTVTGQGLLSPVFVTIEERRPPESTAPPFRSALALTGSGTTWQFSLLGFGTLGLGPIKIAVEAENTAGQKGTASVSITNLPAAIKDRFDQEGGAATFGEFRFGSSGVGCRIAFYERGAISVDSSGDDTLIRGDILAKLLAIPAYLQANFLTSLPFGLCPLGEERAGPGGSRVQDFGVRVDPNDPTNLDFNGVRIYSHATVGTFFVPSVFARAIDKNDGEEATGIPIMDPTSSSGAMQTWLFQRFTRPNPPLLFPRVDSTLEIRGTPPLLWIERQGGKLSYPRGINFSATLWESFRCSDLLGPCEVDPPEGTPLWESTPCRCTQEPCTIEPPYPPPGPSMPIDLAGDNDKFCYGTVYADCDAEAIPPSAECQLGAVPEWSAILGNLDEWPTERAGNHTSTPLFGLAIESAMAGEDNPLTHQYYYDCPPCPSDWNVAIFPLGPQRGIAPHTSFVAQNTYVELEYETTYANVPHIFMDWPFMGDLFFAAGRWIIDCGHGPPTGDPYRSELHPTFMWAKMKTETYLGRPATRADIWVNGWYPGDLIEFDIFRRRAVARRHPGGPQARG
jgi:hypothetical protein